MYCSILYLWLDILVLVFCVHDGCIFVDSMCRSLCFLPGHLDLYKSESEPSIYQLVRVKSEIRMRESTSSLSLMTN